MNATTAPLWPQNILLNYEKAPDWFIHFANKYIWTNKEASSALKILQDSEADINLFSFSSSTKSNGNSSLSRRIKEAISAKPPELAFWDGEKLYLLWHIDPKASHQQLTDALLETLSAGATKIKEKNAAMRSAPNETPSIFPSQPTARNTFSNQPEAIRQQTSKNSHAALSTPQTGSSNTTLNSNTSSVNFANLSNPENQASKLTKNPPSSSQNVQSRTTFPRQVKRVLRHLFPSLDKKPDVSPGMMHPPEASQRQMPPSKDRTTFEVPFTDNYAIPGKSRESAKSEPENFSLPGLNPSQGQVDTFSSTQNNSDTRFFQKFKGPSESQNIRGTSEVHGSGIVQKRDAGIKNAFSLHNKDGEFTIKCINGEFPSKFLNLLDNSIGQIANISLNQDGISFTTGEIERNLAWEPFEQFNDPPETSHVKTRPYVSSASGKTSYNSTHNKEYASALHNKDDGPILEEVSAEDLNSKRWANQSVNEGPEEEFIIKIPKKVFSERSSRPYGFTSATLPSKPTPAKNNTSRER